VFLPPTGGVDGARIADPRHSDVILRDFSRARLVLIPTM
jgi:hypothetical protein